MVLTRDQVTVKIYNLQKQKNAFEKQKVQYTNSLNTAYQLVNNLRSTISSINITKDYMNKYFNINGKIPRGSKLVSSNGQLVKMMNELNNDIIPSIRLRIRSLIGGIDRLSNEIRRLKNQLANMK